MPALDLARRADLRELMDTADHSPEVVEETLRFLVLTNRWFGGTSTVLRCFEAWSRRWTTGAAVRVLDAGAGAADIPLALARWGRSRGFRVEVTAVDVVPGIADAAARRAADEPRVSVRRADLFDLVRDGETFDYVTASLFLHHTPPGDEVRFLRAFDALARRGVLVSDLRRDLASYWAVSALARLAGNGVVRHDGPVSVRRAFRAEELRDLAREARLPYLTARREPWFRVSLSGEKA
jgi:2-polyprenyl-3-methyl-5-hydroxy-6-metoxy-1,4-benzoquinol methylase